MEDEVDLNKLVDDIERKEDAEDMHYNLYHVPSYENKEIQ